MRVERISTVEDIKVIRGIDVSGQNGEAVIMSFNIRSIELLFTSDGVGKGFNFSLQLYTNGVGAVTKSVSLILIALSIIIGLTCRN